jgi:hypothetical protein
MVENWRNLFKNQILETKEQMFYIILPRFFPNVLKSDQEIINSWIELGLIQKN